MTNGNNRILYDVRDTMKQMLHSAELQNWDNVSILDRQRTGLLASLSKTEYTGELELIDEIIKLDREILESAEKARSKISEKVTQACHTRGVHREYQSIADLQS